MHVRCPGCRATTWLNLARAPTKGTVRCRACSAQLPVGFDRNAGRGKELKDVALNFSHVYEIDLFSANAVVLGVMTLERAMALEQQAPERTTALADLAAPQAPLATRRPRPIEKLPEKKEELRPTSIFPMSAMMLVGGTILVIIVTVASQDWRAQVDTARRLEHQTGKAAESTSTTPATAEAVAAPAAAGVQAVPVGVDVHRDAEGRLLKVTAQGPAAVLEAICSFWPDSLYEPLEVGRGGPTGRARFGLLRSRLDLREVHAVAIVRAPGSNRWQAGDGTRPIAFLQPDNLRLTGTTKYRPPARDQSLLR